MIGAIGYLNQHSGLFISLPIIADFYANVAAELASIAITVLVIDTLNERRSIQQEKASLIRQMGSPSNQIAREAARAMRVRGWLEDGSLQDADIARGNLQDAWLQGANLKGAALYKTNLNRAHMEWSDLTGARSLEDSQLVQLRNLRGTMMPDGIRYDGRYNLFGDLRWALKEGVDIDDPGAMAQFYRVPLESHKQGQVWARQNQIPLQAQVVAQINAGTAINGNQIAASQTNQVISQKAYQNPVNLLSVFAIGVFLLNLFAELVRRRK